MSILGKVASRSRAVLGLILLCALLGTTAYIYSPWHQHDLLARKTCNFCQIESSPGVQASEPLHLDPPASILLLHLHSEPAKTVNLFARLRPGRAPPA